MMKILYTLAMLIGLSNCNNPVKNTDVQVVVEEGTEVIASEKIAKTKEDLKQAEVYDEKMMTGDEMLGFWVGYFEQDTEDAYSQQTLYVDEGYVWRRENKINISIDAIKGDSVIGHSVVAGNDRPFLGTVEKKLDSADQSVIYSFQVSEPGDDKYDGQFSFRIAHHQLIGKWQAYQDIEVNKRKYSLEKKHFRYDPDIGLEHAKTYVNWEKSLQHTEEVEYDEGLTEEWIVQEFASATNKIYEINASTTLLNKSDVENLKKGDLTIIRNTIYARHGYSFKNRPLRVFFDAQSWYIPVHTDIRADFTEIEKSNIKLLLNYEKNAAEYYDSFGRG